MDTSVLQFYPTLFVLATDVLDMLGDMVWKRIQQKAEFSEDGTFLCSLPGLNLFPFVCLCHLHFHLITTIMQLDLIPD
jgi:hypothetical protein